MQLLVYASVMPIDAESAAVDLADSRKAMAAGVTAGSDRATDQTASEVV